MNMAMLVMATCVAMKGLQLVAVTLWRLRRDLRRQGQQVQQQSQQLQQQGQQLHCHTILTHTPWR